MLNSRLLGPALMLIALSPLPVSAQDNVFRAPSPDEVASLLHLPERQLPGLQAWVDAAAEAAPRVIEARLQKLTAEAAEEETRSLTRPRADAFGDFSYRENSETQDGSFKPYYNVSAEQPLWHWSALTNQKRIAEIQKKLAANDYAEARRTLILEIRRAYLDLVLKKLSLAETSAAYERQLATLKVNRDRAARGEYASDLLATTQLDARKAEVVRDRQQAALEHALRAFALLNGRDVISADSLPADVTALPASVRALFHPEVSATPASSAIPAALARPEGDLEAARLRQEVTRVRNYPMVNLAAGADQGAASGTDQTAVVNYFAGVRVRWNIFDGFATRTAVKQARLAVRQNEKALAEACSALVNQLKDQSTELALSLRELDLAEESYGLTASRLKVDEDFWKTGRLAEADWQVRRAAGQNERIALYDLRGRVLLQLSEHALLRERATKPSDEIQFP